MDPNFRLLKLVDPSKSVVKIKDCFSKLTLSSNKKAYPAELHTEEEHPPKPPSVRSHPSRRLFDDFLTDDESDSEATELNRIFCSRTTKTDGNGDVRQEQHTESPRRGSKIFSQRLELSDSDATNCSAEMAPRDDPVVVVSQMDRLEVSATQETSHKSSQKLFSEESPKSENEAAELCQLSSKLSSLQLGGRRAADMTGYSLQQNLDAELENIFKKQREEGYVEIDNEMKSDNERRISILTISSARSTVSEIEEDDDDSEVIIISESESEEDVNNKFIYRVSETKLTDEMRQSMTISGSMAERLNAFFNNIPSLDSNQGPERIFQQPEAEDNSVVSAAHSVQNEEDVPDDSIEICETPEASEAGDRPAEIPPRQQSPSPTKDTSFSSPPRKPQTPEPCSPTDNKKTPTTSFIQNLASPRRSPRKTPAKNYVGFQSPLSPKIPVRQLHSAQRSPPFHRTTPKQPVASTSAAKPRTATPKKQQTPRTLTPKASQTPKRTPTPRTRKKAEPPTPPHKASEPAHTHSPAISTPPDPSPDLDSSSSPEVRIERINISAKIKIRLQFNDSNDFVASVGTTTPTGSKASKNTPRLTESEEPTADSPRRGTPRRSDSPQMGSQSSSKTGRGSEQMVGTPEHLKQRSIKDPSVLTVIDLTKSPFAPLVYLDESLMTEEAAEDQKRNATKSPLKSLEASLMTEEAPEDNKERNSPLAGKDNDLQSKMLTPEKPLESDLPAIEIHSPGDHAAAPQDFDQPFANPEVISKQLLTSPRPPIPQKSPEQLELDEKAHRLLNELYGDAWRTPEVVRTLKEVVRSQSYFENDKNVTVNESVMDFTKFHKNIQSDLESTRLQPTTMTLNTKTENVFKMPATDRKVTQTKRNVAAKAMTERRPTTRIRVLNPFQRIQTLHNDDKYSSDSSDIDASSDESWRDVFSGNSDASSENDESPSNISSRKPPRTKKNTTKKPAKGDLIYLDLSNEIVKIQEVNDSPCANKDPKFQDRLEEVLATCKAPDKPKIAATLKNTKIKRKLFTPRFGEEDESAPATPERRIEFKYKDDDDDNNVTLSAPLPAIFEPINKQLEAVKTGKPIFAIRTPTTTPAEKNKENIPSNNKDDPFASPSRKQKTLNKTLADTPRDKYSFLQSLDSKFAKKYCHPRAVVYRDNYKTKKVELADTLFEIYNDQIFGGDLTVPMVWNKKLLNTAGRCSCSTKLGKRQCRIELSDKVLTSADRLRCTLIHELCHAATWILNGEHGHGATWKKWARRANQVFPELPKIGVCHDYDIDYKYTYKCTLCNAKSHAHSKSKKVENIRCAYCHGAIEVFLNKKDKDGNVLPTPVKEPTGFAKFVKDNYKKHKHPDLKHADVMKLLSNEFAAINVNAKK